MKQEKADEEAEERAGMDSDDQRDLQTAHEMQQQSVQQAAVVQQVYKPYVPTIAKKAETTVKFEEATTDKEA